MNELYLQWECLDGHFPLCLNVFAQIDLAEISQVELLERKENLTYITIHYPSV